MNMDTSFYAWHVTMVTVHNTLRIQACHDIGNGQLQERTMLEKRLRHPAEEGHLLRWNIEEIGPAFIRLIGIVRTVALSVLVVARILH